jgi:signal transduction histidine kinase/DNA-binding response OmpR family regulator/HAMP domain-containing protein
MASNLTGQVRGIAGIVTAVAEGDLKRRLVLQASGEIAALANTINEMIDTLATFAEQVTTVAHEVGVQGVLGGQARVPGAAGTWKDLTDNVNRLAANLTTQVRAIGEVAKAVAKGDLSRSINVEALGEVAALRDDINEMIRNLKDTTQKNAEQDWLKTNLARFTDMLQGHREISEVANLILSEVASLVGARHGLFYLRDEDGGQPVFRLKGSYAFQKNDAVAYRLQEGIVGQCAFEKQRILIVDAPHDYVPISSGLGGAMPANILTLPVLFEGEVKAVLELASFSSFSETHLAFLDRLTQSIGIVLNSIEANLKTEDLLLKSQSLARELQSRQEELTKTNKQLEQQTQTLKASEELLTQQQKTLQQTNEELEEKAKLLVLQNEEVERKNREIEQARHCMEDKAEQLALTSKYKSEFLANMSHELRTPLNSMLILSKLLSDNPDANLTAKQIEYARTIHESGTDLLTLINDILDLSKIESGTISIELSDFAVSDLVQGIHRIFKETAESRGLEFKIEIDPATPATLNTDCKRLQQVLKNLLSNAFKFTETGSVTLKIKPEPAGQDSVRQPAAQAQPLISFAVIDTGIGIAPEKQKLIFEAFQQADGSTCRKYGGTGLGLPISRELANLLGAEICLDSVPERGSTFTLYLPQKFREPKSDTNAPGDQVPDDDREILQEDDRVVLILEDDRHLAGLLLAQAHEHGFKGIIAGAAETTLALAARFSPDALTLDLTSPELDGWALLDRLNREPQTRQMPVHVISASAQTSRPYHQSSIANEEKPATIKVLARTLQKIKDSLARTPGSLLLVEKTGSVRRRIIDFLAGEDLVSEVTGSGTQAIERLQQKHFDCVVLDPDLPDMKGADLIRFVRERLANSNLPVIVYPGRDLLQAEEIEFSKFSRTIVVKEPEALEQLLEDNARFLNKVTARLPSRKQKMPVKPYGRDSVLADRKLLVVDDDIHSLFALTSIFQAERMKVICASNGCEALRILEENQDVDLILMDIMMPELDGYETIKRLREIDKYKSLPIIALTARAMQGDREKCFAAGASDYIAKPVQAERLKSLLRAWLYK